MEQEGFIRVTEAREVLGISKTRMSRLLRDDERLPFYKNTIDGRVKWLKRSDVERVKQELAAMRRGDD